MDFSRSPKLPSQWSLPGTAQDSFATSPGGVRPVPRLRQIVKLQPCGFQQKAGKFDAGFPDVRSLWGSAARHSMERPAGSILPRWRWGAECRVTALTRSLGGLPSHQFAKPKPSLFSMFQLHLETEQIKVSL